MNMPFLFRHRCVESPLWGESAGQEYSRYRRGAMQNVVALFDKWNSWPNSRIITEIWFGTTDMDVLKLWRAEANNVIYENKTKIIYKHKGNVKIYKYRYPNSTWMCLIKVCILATISGFKCSSYWTIELAMFSYSFHWNWELVMLTKCSPLVTQEVFKWPLPAQPVMKISSGLYQRFPRKGAQRRHNYIHVHYSDTN